MAAFTSINMPPTYADEYIKIHYHVNEQADQVFKSATVHMKSACLTSILKSVRFPLGLYYGIEK